MILDVARCYLWLFTLYINIKISKNSCLTAVHLAVACDVYDDVFLCFPFSHEMSLDEILNLIESVSEGFPSYLCCELAMMKTCLFHIHILGLIAN